MGFKGLIRLLAELNELDDTSKINDSLRSAGEVLRRERNPPLQTGERIPPSFFSDVGSLSRGARHHVLECHERIELVTLRSMALVGKSA